MAIEIQRPCLWCGKPHTTKRASKKVCSPQCQNRLDYVRRRDWSWLDSIEFEKVINNWLAEGSHPNAEHPINAVNNALADVYRLATEVVKAEHLLLSVAAEAGAQPEKSLADIINEVKTKQ
jgi:hypothetical protein